MHNPKSRTVSFSIDELRTYDPSKPPNVVSDRRCLEYWNHTYHNMTTAKGCARIVVYKPISSAK